MGFLHGPAKQSAGGDRFEIYWDGSKVIDARDATFPNAGKIGVWTKADSVTYFKDLRVEPLALEPSQRPNLELTVPGGLPGNSSPTP